MTVPRPVRTAALPRVNCKKQRAPQDIRQNTGKKRKGAGQAINIQFEVDTLAKQTHTRQRFTDREPTYIQFSTGMKLQQGGACTHTCVVPLGHCVFEMFK